MTDEKLIRLKTHALLEIVAHTQEGGSGSDEELSSQFCLPCAVLIDLYSGVFLVTGTFQ